MKDLIRTLHQRWPEGVPIDDYADFIEALLESFFEYAGTKEGEWVRKKIFTIDEFIKNPPEPVGERGPPTAINTHRITTAKQRELAERATGEKIETFADAERAGVNLHKINSAPRPPIRVPVKKQMADTYSDAMKRIKINPQMAEIIKGGFNVHENEDGSLELRPLPPKAPEPEYEPEVLEDDSPLEEGEERIAFDERKPGVASMADLEIRARDDAQRRHRERKGG